MKTIEPSRHEIWKMFDAISPTYDRVNRIMTFGFDRYWRKAMTRFLPKRSSLRLLDCATGTADQLLSLVKHSKDISQAVGIDLSTEMLEIGRKKAAKSPYSQKITLENGDALALAYPDNSFDCVTMSFGIRNVTDPLKCLKEIYRVLKPGGRILVLESAIPREGMRKKVFLLYFRHIMPRLAGFISKNKVAYRYLNQTTETFPQGESFCSLLKEAGFSDAAAHPLTAGAVSIYRGDK